MRIELLAAAGAAGGVLARNEALGVVPRHVLDDAIEAGLLVRVLPNVYALATELHRRETWQLAALKCRPGAALSHLDALELWGLPVPALLLPGDEGYPIHLTSGPAALLQSPIVRHHRRQDFGGQARFVCVENPALMIVERAQAIVESWPFLPELDQRAAIIVGLRDRHVSATMLRLALDRQPRTPGAAQMRNIVELVAAGNHSELEIWGHTNIFSSPSLPPSRPQHPMRIAGRRIFLDRYFEEEKLDVELDGAAYHGRPGQRERDIRRDAALAALGIQTVRFSHPRLHADPLGVVTEIAEILSVRRRQFGLAC